MLRRLAFLIAFLLALPALAAPPPGTLVNGDPLPMGPNCRRFIMCVNDGNGACQAGTGAQTVAFLKGAIWMSAYVDGVVQNVNGTPTFTQTAATAGTTQAYVSSWGYQATKRTAIFSTPMNYATPLLWASQGGSLEYVWLENSNLAGGNVWGYIDACFPGK